MLKKVNILAHALPEQRSVSKAVLSIKATLNTLLCKSLMIQTVKHSSYYLKFIGFDYL